MIARLKHRFRMWWSPSYRLLVLGNECVEAFREGFREGIARAERDGLHIEFREVLDQAEKDRRR